MKFTNVNKWLVRIAAATVFTLATLNSPLSTLYSQQRDYFTPEEIEVIRDQQQIDKRMEVLTKIIDRRFAALKIDVGGAKFTPKDDEKWGVLPESTRAQLLYDIRRILQKAIDDIDSLASRPETMLVDEPAEGKKAKGFAELFPKSVRTLAAAATRYQNPLKTQLDLAADNTEKGHIIESLDMCSQIIASTAKLK